MLRLHDIMTRDVLTMDQEISIREAMELLATRHFGGAPVVAGRRVVGVVSMTDLVAFAASLPGGAPAGRPEEPEWEDGDPSAEGDPEAMFFTELWKDEGADAGERLAAATDPQWNALEEHTVAEAMTRAVRSLSPETDVVEAAAIMTRDGIHRVLVMDDGRLVGIVSLTDIAKAAAANRLTTRTYVFARDSDFDDRGTPDRSPP